MDQGAHANVSRLSAGVHIGTHVDAPHHFLNDQRTVEALPLDALTGPALVAVLPDTLDVVDAALDLLEERPLAPADELAGKILAYLQRTPLMTRTEVTLEDKTQSAIEKSIILLRAHTGHDFSQYKRNTLYRRIERRMGIHQITKMAAYVRYLQENSQELDLLFRELLIGVTNFFRDPAAWEQLREARARQGTVPTPTSIPLPLPTAPAPVASTTCLTLFPFT